MEQFGKYQLLRRLGAGGMAEVFLARASMAQGLAKVLVIKKIHPAFARSNHFMSMFAAEAKISADLNHPNIVQVFDFGHVGQTYFLAMEYVEGLDLLRLLQEGARIGRRVPYGLCAYIVQQICKGLDYAHRKTDEYGEPLGIVHRDVSPQNVLVSWDGAVKITDFGIARARHVHEEEGVVKGKFAYMSPEQARGEPVDRRSDIFSAGIVLYELACARPLFQGKGKEVLEAVKAGAIPRPRDVDPELPPPLEDIILRALAHHPDDRYQTARDLQHALGKFQFQFARENDDLYDSATLAQFIAQVARRDARRDPREGDRSGESHARSVRPTGGAHPEDAPAGGQAVVVAPDPAATPAGKRAALAVDAAAVPVSSGPSAPVASSPAASTATPSGPPAAATPAAVAASVSRPASAFSSSGSSSSAGVPAGPLPLSPSGAIPLATPPPASAPVETRERKHVLVVEGELTGLASLRRQVGEARARKTVAEFFRIAEHVAYKLEAHPHRIDASAEAGDYAQAGFSYILGLPVAGEDDPSRAIRLALALVDALDGIGRDVEPELRLSVGIQRGTAIVKRKAGAPAWEYEVSDRATAFARRLAREAKGGEILVGGGVYRLARGEWNFEELATIDLPDDGLDTHPGDDAESGPRRAKVYRLRGPKEREQRMRDRAAVGEIIGRELELKALRDTWREVRVHRRKRYVLVIGDEGVGKRSLVSAFLKQIPPGEALVMRAAARAGTSDVPYGIVADLARDLLGLAEGAEAREVQRRLAMTAAMLYPDAQDAPEVASLVQTAGLLLGIKPKPGEEIEADEREQRIYSAMRRIEERLSRDRPLVLAAEDVHWADSQSWDLFVKLLREGHDRPVLGIATARPDERILAAAKEMEAIVLHVGELSPEDRMRLVLDRFAPGEDARGLAEKIVAQTGGNPFFIREMIDSLLDRGILAESAEHPGKLVFRRRDAAVQVPTSAFALVATRLDRLPPSEKETLTRAAVLGRVFTEADVTALLGRPAEEDLVRLSARGLVDPGESGRGSYVFRNELTITVAHDLLPPEERAALHRRAAQRLASSPAYREGQDDAVIARHLEAAGDREEAARRYLLAAEHARDMRGNAEAFRHLSRALELLPRSAHADRYRVRAEREAILRAWGQRPQQLREIHQLRREAEALGEPGHVARALTRLAQFYLDVGKAPAARRALGPALEAARRSQDRLIEAEVLRTEATLARSIGENAEALDLCARALALCEGDTSRAALIERAQIDNIRGTALWHMSRLREALEAYAEALVIYKKLRIRRQEARVLNNMAIVFSALGEYDESLLHYKRALKIDTDLGDRVGIARKLGNIGQAYLDVGDLAQAERYLTKALALYHQMRDAGGSTDPTITLGQVYLKRGDPQRARKLFERGLELATQNRSRYQEIRALVYLALAHLECGEPPSGALELARSAARLGRAAPMPVGEMYGLAVEALALAALGQPVEAAARAADAVHLLDATKDPEGAEEILYIQARLARAAGLAEDADRALARAFDVMQSKARRLRDPALRECYLSSSPAREIAADWGSRR